MNFDVWWFKLLREGDAEFVFAAILPRAGLAIPRGEGYFQIAYLGPMGTDAQLREREVSRNSVGTSANCCPKRRHRWRR